MLRNKILYLFILFFASVNYSCANKSDTSLVIGSFKISKVTDGDTFRFEGLDKPTRLLGIDTEETFKTPDAEQKINEISKNWESFYKNERGESLFPVKTDSPLGFEAWKWAEDFFRNVDNVRLEKEDNKRTSDIFGRYLVYLIAVKDGKEINYNIECVRNGYSPYFNKYGNSKRFHSEFTEAQEYARSNKLGIWNPDKQHYPDYDERLKWWNERAAQIVNFENKYSGNENYIDLSDDESFAKLEKFLGKEITVFGSISDVLIKKFPYILRIPHNKDEAFEIVVFQENQNLLKDLDVEMKKNYYVYVRGKLNKYNGKYQIELRDKEQLWME